MPYTNTLYDEDMEKVVNLFLDLLAKKHPEFAAEINRDRASLVKTMTELLKNQPELSKRNLADGDFVKKLSVIFVTALSVNKLGLNPALNPLNKIHDLLKANGIDLNDPRLKLDPAAPNFALAIKSLNEKLKTLKPEVKLAIQKEILLLSNQIMKDLEKAELIPKSPAPAPGANKSEEDMGEAKAKTIALSNVFGINPNVPGGNITVVQYVAGNGLGFPDLNPYPGYAPIDRQNDVNDSGYIGGDFLGMNASTITNMLESSSPFVEMFKEELGKQPDLSLTPRLTH